MTDEKLKNAVAPILTRMSDVVRRPVDWLWDSIIAIGKITIISGDPGLGKSYLTCDLAARISNGEAWPNDPIDIGRNPADVIMLNAEDGLNDTLGPRLDAAGADSFRIVALEGVSMMDEKGGKQVHSFNLARDLERLKEALVQNPETRAVIIDPISAYLGKTDSHSNAEVRGLLAPLAALAEEFRVAMILVHHLNKGGGAKAVYRVNGSLAFAAAARAAWLVAKDKFDPDRRLFLPIKNNLARNNGGLAYKIGDSGKLEWEAGPVAIDADDALGDGERSGKCESAEEWLSELLKHGGKAVKEIETEAESAGISKRTLRRAREALGIYPQKAFGFGGGWSWSLVGSKVPKNKGGQQDDHSVPLGHLGQDGHLGHLRGLKSNNTPPSTHTSPARPKVAKSGGQGIFDENGEPYQNSVGVADA